MQAIFVDAGHGKSAIGLTDNGAVGRFGDQIFVERALNTVIARKVVEILQNKKDELGNCLIQGIGIETKSTPFKKMQFANLVIRENRFSPNQCLGVSIHINSATGAASGFEVWHQKANSFSRTFAEFIVAAWRKYGITGLRPKPIINTKDHWKYHRLYIDDANCRWVLLECGFINNLADMKAVTADISRTAECIANGIMEYIRKTQ